MKSLLRKSVVFALIVSLLVIPNIVFGWDLSTGTYDTVSFLVSSQELNSRALRFSSDGTNMYILGTSADKVFQYTLGTAWDISTATYSNASTSVSARDGTPTGLAFKSDGTKMYIVGDTNNTIYQYSLGTPWDVTTATYDTVSFSVASQDTSPRGIAFNSDGTQLYLAGNSGQLIYVYSLSSAWDISTATYLRSHGSFTSVSDVYFKDSKTLFFLKGSVLVSYITNTDNDFSYGVEVDNLTVTEEPSVLSFFMKSDGTKFYTVGIANDRVYQYSMSSQDIDPPGATALSPTDNSTGIDVDANLSATFDEDVQLYAGGWTIGLKKSSDNSTVEDIDVSSAQVSLVGRTVTLDPSVTLGYNTEYYVTIDSISYNGNAPIMDLNSDPWIEIFGSTTAWSFTTESAPTTVTTYSPTDGATGVSRTANLTLTFDTNISTSTGNIVLYKTSDNSVIETFDVSTSERLSISTDTLTIDPTSSLAYGTSYYVQVDSTAILGTNSADYAGISDTTTWNFTTESAPVTTTTSTAPAQNGSIFMGSPTSLPGYVKPRPQIVYPDGRVVYLDEPNQNTDTPPTQTSPTPDTTPSFTFTKTLRQGQRNNDVLELQKRLTVLGYFTGPQTGYFGPLTRSAVLQFQKAMGLDQVGQVGPLTRRELNK